MCLNFTETFLGGTSAGCAIIGEFAFTSEDEPDNYTMTSEIALNNPFDVHVTIRQLLLATPYFESFITDTHYSQRDRHGRHVAFLARIINDDFIKHPVGLGIDQETSVVVDTYGMQSRGKRRAWLKKRRKEVESRKAEF